MATFVLVHGSWHGGWCYARVARLLRAAGHDVFTPTLTGMGERSHLAGLDINLDMHVRDIVNVFEYEELADVILCGHSYAGMVITGVAGEIPERIRCLFYLDAFVPLSGQSFFDVVTQDVVTWFLSLAAQNGGKVPPIPAASFNVNAADAARVDAICVPQSIASYAQAVRVGAEAVRVARRVYVFASANGMQTFRPFYERLLEDPAWAVHSVPCGHDIMLDKPSELADLLAAEA
jgi:pimeloyl-ACP methyl ester carboxylesterase